MSPTGQQPLNAADRLMLVAHNGLRGVGHGGFICQTHAWLAGRVDVPALQAALVRLHGQYPVVTARLEEPGGKSAPFWRFHPDSPPVLHESTIAGSDDSAVWSHAARLFETPLDHDRADPIAFHLLHLPDGRDVVVLVFSHVLMDGKSPEYVLKEMDRHFHEMKPSPAPQPSADDATNVDDMAAHLYRFDKPRRRQAAWNVVKSHIRLPVRPVTMTAPHLKDWLGAPYGIVVRRMNEDRTAVLLARATQLCGFPNPTPAIVASVFRTIGRLAPHRQTRRTLFQTDLPLNLRLPGTMEPIFHNFMSFVQITARKAELEDRDDATRRFNTAMRDQLRRGIDLGNLQMMHVMAPRAHLLKKHIIARMRNQPFTLGFGFLGPVSAGLERLFGRDVTWLYGLNSAISPPGVTLEVNQFGAGMNLMLTFIESAVPRAMANDIVDGVIDDLTHP